MGQEKNFDFSKRAQKYDAGFEGRVSKPFYRALLSQVKLNPENAVLDVGCGTGFLLNELSRIVKINGYGIDVEANMVRIAKDRCADMDIRLCSCDSTPYEDASFDVITACMSYHHFPNKDGFARETARLLKQGGHLYIADPRFPFFIRKALNGAVRLAKVSGEFLAPNELCDRFKPYGFALAGAYRKGYVQVVDMERTAKI